jgi:hypothetical protein
LFFGPDLVYQFNPARQLRRAFVAGTMFKAERGRLVALHRHREPDRVVLLRRDLNDEETAEFMAAMAERLEGLRDALGASRYSVVGQVPADADVPGRVAAWLDQVSEPPTIADQL